MRRVVCRLEDALAKRVFELAAQLGVSRDELVRNALHEYLQKVHRRRVAQMKAGYRRMAPTNASLAAEALAADEADWEMYEKSLVEGDPV